MNVSSPNTPENTKLNRLLQNYQLFAMNALGGPALLNAELSKLAAVAHFNENYTFKAALNNLQSGKGMPHPLPFDFKLPSQLLAQQKPILMRADSVSEQGDTILEGEKIACFEIGGEKRLCLPQLLKTVLAKFSLDLINQACDDLLIYCSRCNPEQLDLFRRTGNLPDTARTCGLITMTDAERLCATLLHSTSDYNYFSGEKRVTINESCLPVYHECFGEGAGLLKPELYCSPDAKCIECIDCGKLFSTQRFVGHSHRNQENRICHWGFDRRKWRSYLLFDEDAISNEAESIRLEELFDAIVNKYGQRSSPDVRRKRKTSVSPLGIEEEVKMRRFSDSQVMQQQQQQFWPMLSPCSNMTFSPHAREEGGQATLVKVGLQKQKSCPPTLEDPDRVVPSCESNRYEKHFVPNIALQQSNDLQANPQADDVRSDDVRSDNTQSDHEKGLDKMEETGTYQLKDTVSTLPGTTDKVVVVLESLAKMENLYRQLLLTATINLRERESLEQMYVSHSDTIRRQFVSPTSEHRHQ